MYISEEVTLQKHSMSPSTALDNTACVLALHYMAAYSLTRARLIRRFVIDELEVHCHVRPWGHV
jgi:hypothetical protein